MLAGVANTIAIKNLIIESQEATIEQAVTTVCDSNGVDIFAGSDQVFIDMYTNPSLYAGRIIYLTSLGTPQIAPFVQVNKFYFNEGGIWFPSPFIFG